MMKKVRIAIVVFFIAVTVVFGTLTIRRRLTTDYRAPVIKADSDTLIVSISATDEDLLKGMTAYDNIDGDVTDKLVVESKGKFVSKGTLHVTYAAFDSNRNVATKTREVIYVDYVSPHFHLYSPLRYPASSTGTDYLENMTAEDCLDGSLKKQIKVSLGKAIAVSGTVMHMPMDVQVTNSCGDTAVLELTVSLEDYSEYSKPVPALREYIVYVPKGGAIDLRSFITGVWSAGVTRDFSYYRVNPDSDIYVYENGLDLNVPGIYEVTYSLIRGEGEEQGNTTLIVIVED
ncbi:MAG: DUF5011 domain-containing protein [Clostridiales bacterium]|nr:DUF5011 domain-containing protein [Clostridiales bacterium]